jgi:membrane fusion protein, multidrug efflux system
MMSASSPRHRWPKHGRNAAVLLAAILASGCTSAAKSKGGDKVVEVDVTTPTPDEVTDYQDFTGRLDALKTVDVRPRVSGYVMDAPFKEGDIVQEGQLLFQIDPRTYKADFEVAEANLRQAEAERNFQIKKADRDRQLVKTGSIQKEEYEQSVANRDKAIATVGAMQASRDRAELYLKFTRVVAPSLRDDEGRPLSGRISRRQVDPGNLVNADQTILTTIVTEDRMYAYFDVDERTYLELVEAASPGSGGWFSTLAFPVLMRLANQDEFTTMGHVNFLDNRLNANTGTVRMRGVFDNPKRLLKSGLFVRIRLPIGIPYKTQLITDEALQSDQGRKYVFVVKTAKDSDGKDIDKVEYRAVTLGQSINGMRVIKEGLSEGDRVIITGMQRVRPGAVVRAKSQPAAKPPESSLTKLLTANQPEAGARKTDAPAPKITEMAPSRSSSGQPHSRSGR